MLAKKVWYRALLIALVLAIIPGVVFAGTLTWTDGTTTVSAITPNTYYACPAGATTDTIQITGLPADYHLEGSVKVDFVDYSAPGGRVNYRTYPVSFTSRVTTSTFSQVVDYPAVTAWHLTDAATNTYELHVDVSISVTFNGQSVGWIGGDIANAPGTIGPGQDWDLYCQIILPPPPPKYPGTGTPGYWKNHPEAWPVQSLTIGGISYTQTQLLYWMGLPDGDKTMTMLRALVAAKLNVLVGNPSGCIASTIASADAWMTTYGPPGSGVAAKSAAWRAGEPLYKMLDSYNNGYMCAPHRD